MVERRVNRTHNSQKQTRGDGPLALRRRRARAALVGRAHRRARERLPRAGSLKSLAVVVAPDAAGTTWVLAACADDGATATLRYDRRSGMACAAAPSINCAGVVTAKDGFAAFGRDGRAHVNGTEGREPSNRRRRPKSPSKIMAAALEATLRNVDGPKRQSLFHRSSRPRPQIRSRRRRPPSSRRPTLFDHKRAALDAAIEGLIEETDDEQKVNAERLLQTTQRRLDVFARVLDAAARCGSTLDDGAWGRAWARFRDGDAGAHAKEACERGHASVAAVLWRELRFDDGDARTRARRAPGSRADARAVKCVGRITSRRARGHLCIVGLRGGGALVGGRRFGQIGGLGGSRAASVRS